MPDQTLALAPAETFTFEPQDRSPKLTLARILSSGLSLFVILAALYQARNVNFSDVVGLIPDSPVFWLVFAIAYLVGPISEWFIFRRLWGVGPRAFAALVRKLIYNELLVGYLGEAYFYGWARKNLKFVTAPFGAVKDVAVLSAMAGNIITLIFLALAFPFVRLLPLHDHAEAIGWSLAFVIGSSLAVMLCRRTLFSLERRELTMVFLVNTGRILASTFLSASLWYIVLPDTALVWWLVLATIRLLISRLPFVPNKDVVFAGVAVLALGQDAPMAELIAAMAAIILTTHILVGLTFAFADLFVGKPNAPSTR